MPSYKSRDLFGRRSVRRSSTYLLGHGRRKVRCRSRPNPLSLIVGLPRTVSDKDRLTSEMMRQNFLRMVRSVRPLLLSFGYFEETVDKWSAGAIDEIENMKNKYYVRVCPLDKSIEPSWADLSVLASSICSGCLHGRSNQESRSYPLPQRSQLLFCLARTCRSKEPPAFPLLPNRTMYQQASHAFGLAVLLPLRFR